MASKTSHLDRIHVVSACMADWELMTGSEQVRHCAECNREVYDLSKMTHRQAEHMIIISQGNFCARITRAPDGTVVTQEEQAPRLMTRCASPVAAAVVSAVISVASTAPALAAGPGRQAQITSAAPAKNDQFTEPKTPFNPIILEPADPSVLGVPIGIPVVQGLAIVTPMTLRALYETSDLIVIGRAAWSSAGDAGSDQIVTKYRVSAVLKGKSRKPQVSVIHYERADESFADGKIALLFLSKGTALNGGSQGSYVLADRGNGVKALAQAELDSYVARIQDLDTIERREHSAADIIEWLVQCAEDPATGWEGACDLSSGSIGAADAFFVFGQSSDRPAYGIKNIISFHETEPEKLTKADAAGGSLQSLDAVSSAGDVLRGPEHTDSEANDDAGLASMLTAEQRERLVTALLATQTVGRGELKLIEVIETWNDARLVDFLLARLHGMEDDPTDIADQLVQKLSDIVGGCEVSALADSFKDLPSAEDTSRQSENEENDQERDDAVADGDCAGKIRELVQKRSAALKEFLALVEAKLRSQPSLIR